jgi:hypothetical protein
MPILAARPRLLRAARATLAAAAAVAVGCTDSDDTLSPNAVAGSYVLVSYQGRALPVSEVDGGVRSDLIDGELNLRRDRTFDIVLESRDTYLASGTVRRFEEVYSGRYSINGRVLTFSGTTADRLEGQTATVSGTTVTVGDFVFRQ